VQLHLALAVDAPAPRAPAGEWNAEGTIVNTSGASIAIDWIELASPSLALELVDDDGTPVQMLPPPTPGRPEAVVLQPGERRWVRFTGFVPTSARTGRYRVRWHYRDAHSDWAEFELR